MWTEGRVCTLTLACITCVHYSVDAVVSPCSEGVALLGTQYTIQADRSNYTAFVWVRPDGRYVVTCYPICSPVGGYSARRNVTHSTLTIDSVRMPDAGTWSIFDATAVDAMSVQVCQLTIVNLPQCNISSGADPATLQPNTTLTLTVDIKGYYCSQEAGFDLTTGDIRKLLMKQNVTGVTDVITSSTFNVTSSRLGDVTVSFMCDVTSWDLKCDGVRNLSMARFVPLNPTDFYCTSHTESSVELQWVHPGNTLCNLEFVLNYRLMEDKGGIDDRNITIPADKSETMHTTTLKELQTGSLYYFRLVVDGGFQGQSEAVTTTCFTRRSEGSESSGTSLGAGVGIGIAVTLAALAVCLGAAYVFRRKLSAICAAKDSTDKYRKGNVQFSETSQERTSSVNNHTEEGTYEVPVPQNPYDDLQPPPATEPQNTYEQLRQYHNIPH